MMKAKNAMNAGNLRSLTLLVALVAAVLTGVGCSDDSSAVKENIDAGPVPGLDGGPAPGPPKEGVDGGPKDCFDNPKTHFEIINACTTATRITKNPTLGKLLLDGGLPPLN